MVTYTRKVLSAPLHSMLHPSLALLSHSESLTEHAVHTACGLLAVALTHSL